MLHNDTPKFTIPTTRSFSKSLALSLSLFSRLHFEREQDQSKRIVNSRTLSRRPIDENRRRHGFCESRKIGDASVMVFFFSLSLHAGKVNAYFWSGWLSRHPRILCHQHRDDKVRSRVRDISRTRLTLPRTHACDLVHARVFLFFFSLERRVTQPAREQRWDFEHLERSETGENSKNFFLQLSRNHHLQIHLFIFFLKIIILFTISYNFEENRNLFPF